MIQTETASVREVVWTVAMLVALLALLVSWCIIAYKFYLYRRPDPVTGKRRNGAGVWLFIKDSAIKVLLITWVSTFTAVGFVAMTIPEPVRSDTQRQNDLVANVSTIMAIMTALFALFNLWCHAQIDRELGLQRDKRAQQQANTQADIAKQKGEQAR